MTMVQDMGQPNEEQLTSDEKTSAVQRTTTVMSDTSTLRGDTSPSLLRPTPRIVIENTSDLVRSNSCPPLSPDDGVIPVPGPFNEQTTRRMEWIMQTSMDALLPTLRPEQRKLIEGTTDLRQLIASLFESWEAFRSSDDQGNKNRKIARSVYEKMKSSFTNNELFERFWANKSVAEKDGVAWGRFKSVVSIVLNQASAINNILNSMNMCNVPHHGGVADYRLWPLHKLFSGYLCCFCGRRKRRMMHMRWSQKLLKNCTYLFFDSMTL